MPVVDELPLGYDEHVTREPKAAEEPDAYDCMYEAEVCLRKARRDPDKRRALLDEAKDWIEIAEEKL